MRPVTISQTGVGIANPARVDYRQEDFGIGFAAVVTGTATYTIEHTFDAPSDYESEADYNTNATWFDNDDPQLVGATTNQSGNYAFPFQASRINVTAGTGTVEATYIQGHAS